MRPTFCPEITPFTISEVAQLTGRSETTIEELYSKNVVSFSAYVATALEGYLRFPSFYDLIELEAYAMAREQPDGSENVRMVLKPVLFCFLDSAEEIDDLVASLEDPSVADYVTYHTVSTYLGPLAQSELEHSVCAAYSIVRSAFRKLLANLLNILRGGEQYELPLST